MCKVYQTALFAVLLPISSLLAIKNVPSFLWPFFSFFCVILVYFYLTSIYRISFVNCFSTKLFIWVINWSILDNMDKKALGIFTSSTSFRPFSLSTLVPLSCSQLPGRLFSPSDISKKLSLHFLLYFPIGMGSYDHHAKYQGVFMDLL